MGLINTQAKDAQSGPDHHVQTFSEDLNPDTVGPSDVVRVQPRKTFLEENTKMLKTRHFYASCAALAVAGVLLSAPAFPAKAQGGDTAKDIPGGEAGVPPGVQATQPNNPMKTRPGSTTKQTLPQHPAASQDKAQKTLNNPEQKPAQ